MRHSSKFVVVAAAAVAFLPGCRSHQAKVDALQKEYDRLSKQFAEDCSAEYLKVPPTLSEKCSEESKKMGEAGQRLREELAKQ